MKILHMQDDCHIVLAKKVCEVYKSVYPDLLNKKNLILDIFKQESEKFAKALENGLSYLKNWGKKMNTGTPSEKETTSEELGDLVFYMYESYGFPADDTIDEMTNMGLQFDKSIIRRIFDEKFKKHQEVSRAGAEKKFGGHGLVQIGELKTSSEEDLRKVTKLHTATHLLHQALRSVLGDYVKQMGSDITSERLRFDFTHLQKMTDEEKKKVEDLVNDQIKKALPVKVEEMDYEEALKSGALAFFKEKYQGRVKVYSIGEGDYIFSKELCGGPHIINTKELGSFKILKEESSSAGIRRIRATVSDS